ncbi:hypothetical protein IWZ00DRAFT_544988 [Phyllosticta capitalensis]|uniref:uncharacterized protein n=1 Tax=Phyllosticta capitalensis TaxID=121624 RepID=UPI003130FEC7
MCSGWPSGLADRLGPWQDWEEEFNRWCYGGGSGSFAASTLDWEIADEDFEEDDEHVTDQAEFDQGCGVDIKLVELGRGEEQTGRPHDSENGECDIALLVSCPKNKNLTHHTVDDSHHVKPHQHQVSTKSRLPVLAKTPTVRINVEPVADQPISNLETSKEARSSSESNTINPISSMIYLADQLETTVVVGKRKTQDLTDRTLTDYNERLSMPSRVNQFCTISEATDALEALTLHLMAVLAVTKLKGGKRTD